MKRPTPASRHLPILLLAAAFATLAACAGGLLGGPAPAPGPSSRTVSGEVERIEAYDDEIDVWTDDRRIVTFHYDESTAVWYEGERYAPTALEPGDLVTVQMERVGGEWIASRIDVDQGRQERTEDEPYDPEERYEPDERYDPEDGVATLSGEVEVVDTRGREIEIDSGGERVTFSYRSGTVVHYRGQRYEVANLEPGDVIRTRVERDGRDDWVTDSITVEQSRQERGDDDLFGDSEPPFDEEDDTYGDDRLGDALRYAGTVQEVDRRRGEFVLHTERYGLRTVVMPYDAPTADRDAFNRLRRGDRVEIEVEPRDDGRAALLRFGWR